MNTYEGQVDALPVDPTDEPKAGPMPALPKIKPIAMDPAGAGPADMTEITAGTPLRKPGPNEKVHLYRAGVQCVELLPIRQGVGTKEVTELYYVEEPLRDPIKIHIRIYCVLPFYSAPRQEWVLWPVPVSNTNWYRSVQRMLLKSESFFAEHVITVSSDTLRGQYLIRGIRLTLQVPEMPGTTLDLLAEALGDDHFITTAEHPVYQSLIAGEVIS